MSEDAGIYVRISKARRRDGTVETLGVERQEPPCRDLADQLGAKVAKVYTDNDLRAWKGKEREAYERMLEDIRSGRIGLVIAWQPDRITRNSKEGIRFYETLRDSGAKLATIQGIVDPRSSYGRSAIRQMIDRAELESDIKSERLMLAYEQQARAGQPSLGGIRPFGFERDRITHRRSEVKLIKEAASRLIAGESLSSLVKDWRSRGITTPDQERKVNGKWTVTRPGGPWDHRSLKRTLTGARMVGLRDHRGDTYPATWKPILDRQTWVTLKVLLNSHPAPKSRARRYLLTGLLFCGRPDCGGKLDGQTRANGKRGYECRHCFKLTRLADPIEREVRNQAFDVLASPAVTQAILNARDADKDIQRARNQLQRDQDALDALLASNVLTDREHRKKTRQLQDRAEAIAAKLPTPGPRLLSLRGDETPEGWWLKHKDPNERRQLLSLAIEKIVLLPTVKGRRTFDPATEIDIHWQPVIPTELVAAVLRKRDT